MVNVKVLIYGGPESSAYKKTHAKLTAHTDSMKENTKTHLNVPLEV